MNAILPADPDEWGRSDGAALAARSGKDEMALCKVLLYAVESRTACGGVSRAGCVPWNIVPQGHASSGPVRDGGVIHRSLSPESSKSRCAL